MCVCGDIHWYADGLWTLSSSHIVHILYVSEFRWVTVRFRYECGPGCGGTPLIPDHGVTYTDCVYVDVWSYKLPRKMCLYFV